MSQPKTKMVTAYAHENKTIKSQMNKSEEMFII